MTIKHQMKNRQSTLESLEDRNMFAGDTFVDAVDTEATASPVCLTSNENIAREPLSLTIHARGELAGRAAIHTKGISGNGIIDGEVNNYGGTLSPGNSLVLENGFPHGIINPEIVNGLLKEHVLENGFPHGIINPEIVNGLAERGVLDNGFPYGIIDPEAVNCLVKEHVLDNGFPHGIIDPEAVNGLGKENVLDNGFPHGIIDPEAVNSLGKENVLDNRFPHGIIDPEALNRLG